MVVAALDSHALHNINQLSSFKHKQRTVQARQEGKLREKGVGGGVIIDLYGLDGRSRLEGREIF